MKLPDDFPTILAAHGHSLNGGYLYHYIDTVGLGVHATAHKENARSADVVRYMHQALPSVMCTSLDELRAKLEPITEEDAAAEVAKWPRVVRADAIEQPAMGRAARCNVCVGERAPAVRNVALQTSWVPGPAARRLAQLCTEHAPLEQQPRELLDRLNAAHEARQKGRHAAA